MPSEPGDRIRLTLQYDGAGFHGWQVQPGVRTVQGELEAVLSRLADRPVRVAAAGRTDAGVHATGQVVSVEMPAKWTAAALKKSLDALLPDDVWAADAVSVPPTFHARYSAVARGYAYRVGTVPGARSPFRRRWCWALGEPLDRAVLRESVESLLGRHSFRGYAKSGQPERGYVCEVHEARWLEWSDVGLELRIVANRFLHHMVRYLVGTMVAIARGQRPRSEMARLLHDPDGPERTSPPAPPEGLYLARVEYPPETEDFARDDRHRNEGSRPRT